MLIAYFLFGLSLCQLLTQLRKPLSASKEEQTSDDACDCDDTNSGTDRACMA
jgi:hypothetical protein